MEIIPVIPIDFFYVAVRHADKWLSRMGAHIRGRAAFGMTKVLEVIASFKKQRAV